MKWFEEDDSMGCVAEKLSYAEFRNNIPVAIQALCERFRAAEQSCAMTRTSDEEIAKHGHHRWKQGFSLRELIKDWGILNEVLVEYVEDFFAQNSPTGLNERSRAIKCLSRFITDATSQSVRRFDELRQAEAASLSDDLESVRKKFERTTRQRSQLLREAAHDLRGGLFAISCASEVLKISDKESEAFQRILDSLDRSVESVKGLLDSLLELSRLESGADQVQLEKVDIAEHFRHIGREYMSVARKRNLEFRVEGPDALAVETDAGKIRRIAQNLITNALQHTERGRVELSWKGLDNHWEFSVNDTGPGMHDLNTSAIAHEMDQEDTECHGIDHLTHNSYAGEGIGLVIVKRLCTLLDAGIVLESQADKGSCFTVTLPRTYSQLREHQPE